MHRDKMSKKKPQGAKARMVTCKACKKPHEIAATAMAAHRKEIQQLAGRQAKSRGGSHTRGAFQP